MINSLVAGFFFGSTLGLLGSVLPEFSEDYVSSDLNSAYQDALHFFRGADFGGKDTKDFSRMAVGSYEWWMYVSWKAILTPASVGLVFLENELRMVHSNPSISGIQPFQYVSTAEYFLYPKAMFEPWVVNPDLMTDLAHKNHLDYAIWGALVGNKIRELGWAQTKAVDNSVSSNKVDYHLLQTLQRLKERYLARVAAIRAELNSNTRNGSQRLEVATNHLLTVEEKIAEEERRIQAELDEYNRQQELARQRAEAERAAWRARQAENARLERERAAVEEADRIRREQEALVIASVACFAFGYCQ